jgi:hypothetical protein
MKAFLIIITSAWSGQATNVYPMPDMAECMSVLKDTKTSGDVAAFCSPDAPRWWHQQQEWIAEREASKK